MATSTITRSITIKNARQCKALVYAFERAKRCRSDETAMDKTVQEMTPDVMRKLFFQEVSTPFAERR